MWPNPSRPLGYGLPPEMGMFVVAPTTSFHHPTPQETLISGSVHGPNATLGVGVGVGVGVIPLLTATSCLNIGGGSLDDGSGDVIGNRVRGGAIQLWQGQQQHQQVNHWTKGINFEQNSVNLLASSGGGKGVGVAPGGGGAGGSCSGATTCQDCGNQAKKDCVHRRCRTCCRSRGFDCRTHVKSTWVPAVRRRERQMMAAAAGTATVGCDTAAYGSTSAAKKPRLIDSQNNTATTSHASTCNTPRSFETGSCHHGASFNGPLPGEVRSPAVFKCVRVTAVDDGEDEYAYQAVVKIGGHVFKGFLYDYGLESGDRDGFPAISELHLAGAAGGSGGGEKNGASSSSPLLDPPDVYGASGGGLLGGSSYDGAIIPLTVSDSRQILVL
ncbi:hypothetical protein Nepgr_012166 [Nepenthes gracilis]|uniref:Uncharacterized protein n=1 Tax=Nepenthes gracilis TaxID=150966 RepID=A0AAD3SFA5_NEPGR|nr:hypothetical protein Nepgr_012166 [Nepenthes gracilis]